jgi:hypothetical protein
MVLAKIVGAKGILVQTGQAQESQHAVFVAKDLKEAVNWILENVEPSRHLQNANN